MRTDTIAEQLFFTTARLEGRSTSGASVGTGFICAVETDRGTIHLLVTNKHLLDGAVDLQVKMIASDGSQPVLGQSTEVTLNGLTADEWIGHPDPEVDVAVLPVGPVINRMAANGSPPFFRSISSDMFPTADLLDDLDAIEEVTFVGYPNGLFDTANLLPIARRGTTATPLSVDYQGRPAFLIDASVFPGSSGSPVFLLSRGMYQSRNGATVVGGRFACLGLVAAVHIRAVNGQIVNIATALGVQFQEPIDLGIVFKAVAIDECVDELLRAVGAARRAATVSTKPGELSPADNELAEELAPTSE